MLASNFIRIPPTPSDRYVPPGGSGAIEIIVHHITEELVRRGHDVTLFASGDSQTSAHLVSVTPQATWQSVGIGPHKAYEHVLISQAYKMALDGAFDIIHSHHDIQTASYAPLVKTPTVSTLHGPVVGLVKEILRFYMSTQYYVSISDNQRQGLPELNYATTAYNGIEVNQIPFSSDKDDYLVFVGRLVPEKGLLEAVEVARKVNRQLLIFGSPDETSERTKQYWEQQVRPLIDGKKIIYKGMLPREELFVFLSRARAVLFPLQWEEPFGLVAVEAMAAGTPTIAFRRGSLPEIIEDGKSGMLVGTQDEMVEAVGQAEKIMPEDCRARAQEFSIERMVDRYEEAYATILNRA